MGHKKKFAFFLILCFLTLTGLGGHKVEIITDNGGPLIDLNEQLVNRDLLLPEEDDEEPRSDVTEPVTPKKTQRITVKYDTVHFYGGDFRYYGHEDGYTDDEVLKKDDGESFNEALLRYKQKEGINEEDVFVIADDYGEYYTEQYVMMCLREVVSDDRITFESGFR